MPPSAPFLAVRPDTGARRGSLALGATFRHGTDWAIEMSGGGHQDGRGAEQVYSRVASWFFGCGARPLIELP